MKKLVWCYKRDLHRLGDNNTLHEEEYKTEEEVERRWWLIQRVNGPRVKRLS